MGRVLFALDLGGGYGHLRRCVPLADLLAARGHDIVFAMRGSAYAAEVVGDRPFRLLPAPLLAGVAEPGMVADTWADVLLRTGHGVADDLAEVLRRWLAIFAEERPDVLVADFAPAALIASRIARVPSLDTGSGYTPPPRQVPMPMFRIGQAPGPRQLAAEAQALAAVNAALASVGAAPLPTLADTLATDRTVLMCFPEFDHYGERPGEAYFGNDYRLDDGIEPPWPTGTEAPVFGYLRAGSRGFAAVVRALRGSGVRALLHARDMPQTDEAAFAAPRFAVSARAVQMRAVLAQSRMVVCHSPGTAAAALVAGRPVVLLPEHTEQAMAAGRLVAQGLALAAGPDATDAEVAALLRQALEDRALAARAAAFARRYHGYDPAEALAAIADEVEDVMARAMGVAN
jgi:UDP:flavonoid glycosyltransferase YjiC (YdhE family)